MKMNLKLQHLFLEVVCLLFVLLFAYAAVSKLLDFENFQTQLGQSPLLSAYAQSISFLVIATELVLSFFLAVPKYRTKALYLSVGLMFVFTVYILFILNYSSYVPCSCGGILEKLGWTDHLFFNGCFIVVGMVALLFLTPKRRTLLSLFVMLFSSIALVTVLFLSSENIMQNENPFLRRFIPNSAERTAVYALHDSHYYFIGQRNGVLYLGNTLSPLTVISLDSTLKKRKQFTIQLDNDAYPFRNIRVKMHGDFFFVYDGSVPVIYRGLITNWKAKVWVSEKPYFTLLQPVDSNRCVFRGIQLGTNENLLGSIVLKDSLKINTQQQLLQKQIDGLFDTDGTLQYSEDLRKVVYTYFYRNQFIVADSSLTLGFRGTTIDTTSQANLKVVTLKHSGDTKLAAPPYTVNIRSTVFKQLLFNQSSLRGRYESEKNWKLASIIDMYDITQNTYLSSFYIYHENRIKMSAMIATDKAIYAIIGNEIVGYSFGKPIVALLKK